MLLNHCLLLLTHICFVRGTFRWKLKGGDLEVGEHPVHQNIPELQSALKLADKDLYLNIHTIFKLLIVLTVTSVCCKRLFSALHRLKVNNEGRTCVWLSKAPFSQKHGCESEKHFKTIWCLWWLENWKIFLWITKTCPNLNSSYNYINNFCFELPFLTVIPTLYTKTFI